MEIEIRRGDSAGARLARLVLKPQLGNNDDSTYPVTLNGARDADDLCLVFKGRLGGLIRLNYLEFS